MNEALSNAYRWHKQARFAREYDMRHKRNRVIGPDGREAIRSLMAAREDVANGKARYPSSGTGYGPAYEARGSKHFRWIEKPSTCGLRFVGYADKLANLRHTGWYVDNHQDETVRGVVFQFPGRDGKPLFVAGYEDWNNGKADCDGPVSLDFGDIIEGEASEWIPARDGWSGYWSYSNDARDHEGARDAARRADQIAERLAEYEREYQAAWHAGTRFAELGAEIKGERSRVLELLAERREAIKAGISGEAFAAICRTIRKSIASSMETIREAREERAKLESGDFISEWLPGFWAGDPRLVAAFDDGANI